MRFAILFLVFMSSEIAMGSTLDRLKVKNNTGSPVTITDLGRDIAASTTEDIDLRNASDWSASADIATLIDADTLDILLNSVVLSNADAKEILRSRRLFKVMEEGSLIRQDITQLNFKGPVSVVSGSADGSVDITIDSEDILEGRLLTYHFYGPGVTSNTWMELVSSQQGSDWSTSPVPFNAKIVAMTFGNKSDSKEADIRVVKNGTDETSFLFEWQVRAAKFAYKSDIGPSNKTFSAGDRIRVYLKDVGTVPPGDPLDVHIDVVLQITDNTTGEAVTASGD